MKNRFVTPAFALAVALATLPTAIPRPAAADAMSGSSVDCKMASDMMMKAMPAAHGMAMSDNKMTLDQQYATAMAAHNKMVASMSRVEAACGKDPKTRAMAKSLLDSAMKMQPDLDDLTRHSS